MIIAVLIIVGIPAICLICLICRPEIEDFFEKLDKLPEKIQQKKIKKMNPETKPSAYQNKDYELGYLKCRTQDGKLAPGFEKRLMNISNDLLRALDSSSPLGNLNVECFLCDTYETNKETEYGFTSTTQVTRKVVITNDRKDYKDEITVIDAEHRSDNAYLCEMDINTPLKLFSYGKYTSHTELDKQIAKFIAAKTNEKYRAEGNRVVRSH